MSDGVEQRAQIDTETVRALLLINGGGAVALLTLLPNLLGKPGFERLTSAILVAIAILILGLACAVMHNRFRRKCSLIYSQHQFRPPKGSLLGIKLSAPTVCWMSERLMWTSIACFVGAGLYVAIIGLTAV
jgi:hypothetical protein